MVEPPQLPARLSRTTSVVAVGSTGWLIGAAVLLGEHLVSGSPLGIWFVTCLVGAGLGVAGYGVFAWQRAAARRGSRTAQQGME